MASLALSPLSPVCLLHESGELTGLDGESVGTRGAGARAEFLLLSRALCRFEFLDRRPGLTSREASQSALLHAEAHAPFAEAGWAVYAVDDGHGIWWWDAAKVRQLLGDPSHHDPRRLAPETVAHASTDGWRIVLAIDGYEAQYWEKAVLRASMWRRRMFDDTQWITFVESAPAPVMPPPRTPPAPTAPVWISLNRAQRSRVSISPVWSRVAQTGWSVAAAALLLSTGLWGHAERYRSLDAEQRAALSRLEADVSPVASNAVIAREAGRIARSPQHLIALADALAALDDAGLSPDAWDVTDREIRVVATGSAALDRLGAALEANPRLKNVAPAYEAGAVTIRAEIETSDVALLDGAP